MANISDKTIGSQFDTLDKFVANRAQQLLARDSLTIQDVQEWQTDYNQLAAFGRSNSNVAYVARQWRDEEPRYKNVVSWLMEKVKTPISYTPRLYNDGLSLSAGNGCCNNLTDKSGGNDVVIPQRRLSDFIPHDFRQPSVGDAVKNFFGLPNTGRYATPQIPNQAPLGNEPIPTSNIFQYLLLAGILGGILYAVYKVSKK